MKLFMMVDLEGVSGVVSFKHQAHPGGFLYHEARMSLMRDLNAAVEGAVAAGVEEIVVYDSHFYGLNVVLKELRANVKAVLGKPIFSGLDRSFNAAMLIGYHSMAGTPDGLLAHSYALDIQAIWLNDINVGEIGMEAALAGQLDVPVVMMSGDSAGAAEASSLLPGIELAVVKESMGKLEARCLPGVESEGLIKRKAQIGLKKTKEMKPYKLKPPFEIKIEFSSPEKMERLSQEENVIVGDGNTLTIKESDLHAAWQRYKKVEKEFESLA